MVRLDEAALQDPDGSLRVHLASFGTGMGSPLNLGGRVCSGLPLKSRPLHRLVLSAAVMPAVDAYLTSAQEYLSFLKQGEVRQTSAYPNSV
jgi:hypothetical protein